MLLIQYAFILYQLPLPEDVQHPCSFVIIVNEAFTLTKHILRSYARNDLN